MRVKSLGPEVFEADEPIVMISFADIAFLKDKASLNDRKRMRICAHRGVNDPLHEMIVVHERGAYVRPHKHVGKIESVHIIEGLVDVVLFDDAGAINNILSMGDYVSGLQFYYRMTEPFYHTLLIRSDVLVFHEITNGPFVREQTVFAPWAPADADAAGVNEFIARITRTRDAGESS